MQFLKRMGRLLDNLPERESGSGSGQSTTQSVSTSQRQMDSTDSPAARPTDVPCHLNSREITASLQSRSTTGELQTSVGDTGSSHSMKVSTGCRQLACISAQSELRSTNRSLLDNACAASQQPSRSPSATVRRSPHSRLDVSITRDIPSACRPVSVMASCSRGVLSPVTVSSITGNSEPLCVTTPSSAGRGGLSAYDRGSHRAPSASAEDSTGLIASTAAHSHSYDRPLISRGRHQATVTSSASQHSDWVTTRS